MTAIYASVITTHHYTNGEYFQWNPGLNLYLEIIYFHSESIIGSVNFSNH